jgi:hypothetical protein
VTKLLEESAMRTSRPLRPADRLAVRCLGVLVLGAAAWPALAHHSFAMYDNTKTLTIKGTVKSFEWTNPHIIVWLYAEQQGAEPQLWSLEVSSPGAMTRNGWSRRSLKVGDKVVAEVAPLRDGSHGASLKKVTIPATGVVLIHDVRASCKPCLK